MLIGFYWRSSTWLGESCFPTGCSRNELDFYLFDFTGLHEWLDRAVAVFTFRFTFLGTLAPVVQATTVLLVMWYCCYWLYRRKIFFKL